LRKNDPFRIKGAPIKILNFGAGIINTLYGYVPAQAGNAAFFIFATNWEGASFIDRLLPRERYLMGYPTGVGRFETAGTGRISATKSISAKWTAGRPINSNK